MTLPELLQLKYPTINLMKDCVLADRGEGPFIQEWTFLDIPQPTNDDIAQWTKEFQSAYDLKQINDARQAAYPPKEDLIVALWERVVEGNVSATDDIQAARESVKAEFPQPSESGSADTVS